MQDGQAWPRVSIVTPSYNQGVFLEETIRSVLLQGYPDLEYLVIDGGSLDGSLAIIKKYEPWLDYWVSEADRGQSHAINKGWERVSGDLVAYLNSDDTYFPAALGRVAEAWRRDRCAAVIAGGVTSIDELGQKIKEKHPFLHGESPLDLSLLAPPNWYIPQQSTFFVREHLDHVGRRLQEELHYTMDRELMYRICRQGRVILLMDILAGDRHHSHSKRISQTLPMYREDAVALSLCTWGGSREARRRRKVARWRLAQGHYFHSMQAAARITSLVHFYLAIYFRPSYLYQSRLVQQSIPKIRRLLSR